MGCSGLCQYLRYRPVGLCALINAVDQGPENILAVDSVQSRLDLAKDLGAETWNFQTDRSGLERRVKELTGGRGADAVIGTSILEKAQKLKLELILRRVEVVGLRSALRMAFDLLRPWGMWPNIC